MEAEMFPEGRNRRILTANDPIEWFRPNGRVAPDVPVPVTLAQFHLCLLHLIVWFMVRRSGEVSTLVWRKASSCGVCRRIHSATPKEEGHDRARGLSLLTTDGWAYPTPNCHRYTPWVYPAGVIRLSRLWRKGTSCVLPFSNSVGIRALLFTAPAR